MRTPRFSRANGRVALGLEHAKFTALRGMRLFKSAKNRSALIKQANKPNRLQYLEKQNVHNSFALCSHGCLSLGVPRPQSGWFSSFNAAVKGYLQNNTPTLDPGFYGRLQDHPDVPGVVSQASALDWPAFRQGHTHSPKSYFNTKSLWTLLNQVCINAKRSQACVWSPKTKM